MFLGKSYSQGPNFRLKFQVVLEFLEWESDRNKLTLLGQKMSMILDTMKSNFGRDVITKCDSYFITKCHKSLLFYIKRDSYYKMRHLLQNMSVQTARRFNLRVRHQQKGNTDTIRLVGA